MLSIQKKDVTLYVDGQEAGKEASAFKISDILGKIVYCILVKLPGERTENTEKG